MKQQFITKRFNPRSQAIIQEVDKLLEGSRLTRTVRNSYYWVLPRLVEQAIAKAEKSSTPDSSLDYNRIYQNFAALCKDARMAGLLDFDKLEDLTRVPRLPQFWSSLQEFGEDVCAAYAIDLWSDQQHRVELWCEKSALESTLLPVARKWQIPFASCRGYCSTSFLYQAYRRLQQLDQYTQFHILYAGDFDPSGEDMARSIVQSLAEFGVVVDVLKFALTREQALALAIPAIQVKPQDSRARQFIEANGPDGYELDAMSPELLQELAEQAVLQWLDLERFNQRVAAQEQQRTELQLRFLK